MTGAVGRRELLRSGATIGALGAALTIPGLAGAGVLARGQGSSQDAEILELQAAFHQAKSQQDIDLMMSLYTDGGSLVGPGVSAIGKDALQAFFLGSGSWLNKRISLGPSFKSQIQVDGNTGFIYFECHDVGLERAEADLIVAHLWAASTLRKVSGHWLFDEMHFGAAPLSVETIYYP